MFKTNEFLNPTINSRIIEYDINLEIHLLWNISIFDPLQ